MGCGRRYIKNMKSDYSFSPWPEWVPIAAVSAAMLAAALSPPDLDFHPYHGEHAFYAVTETMRGFTVQKSSTATDGIIDYAPSLSTHRWF